MLISKDCIFHKYYKVYQARLVQSVEHETLNLRVMGSSPTLGDQHFALDAKRELPNCSIFSNFYCCLNLTYTNFYLLIMFRQSPIFSIWSTRQSPILFIWQLQSLQFCDIHFIFQLHSIYTTKFDFSRKFHFTLKKR